MPTIPSRSAVALPPAKHSLTENNVTMPLGRLNDRDIAVFGTHQTLPFVVVTPPSLLLPESSPMAATRREFLHSTAVSALTLSAVTYAGAADKPNDRVRVAVMGTRIRGKQLIPVFNAQANVEITHIIEPDENLWPDALKLFKDRPSQPKTEKGHPKGSRRHFTNRAGGCSSGQLARARNCLGLSGRKACLLREALFAHAH